MTKNTLRKLMTPVEVADYLDVTIRKLRYMRATDTGPRWTRAGREIRYARADVERYLIEQARK